MLMERPSVGLRLIAHVTVEGESRQTHYWPPLGVAIHSDVPNVVLDRLTEPLHVVYPGPNIGIHTTQFIVYKCSLDSPNVTR
jgi:hypothetical protein